MFDRDAIAAAIGAWNAGQARSASRLDVRPREARASGLIADSLDQLSRDLRRIRSTEDMLLEAERRLHRSNRSQARRTVLPLGQLPAVHRLRATSDTTLLAGRRAATDLDRAEDAEIERELQPSPGVEV